MVGRDRYRQGSGSARRIYLRILHPVRPINWQVDQLSELAGRSIEAPIARVGRWVGQLAKWTIWQADQNICGHGSHHNKSR